MHNLNNYTVLRQKLQSEPVENEGNEAWINKIFSTFPFLYAVMVPLARHLFIISLLSKVTINCCFSNCCGFGWDAMIHGDSSISFGDAAVTAFAVYSQSVKCSFVSKLSTSIRRPVCAWLIADAQIAAAKKNTIL